MERQDDAEERHHRAEQVARGRLREQWPNPNPSASVGGVQQQIHAYSRRERRSH
jgi:hypothetical protein